MVQKSHFTYGPLAREITVSLIATCTCMFNSFFLLLACGKPFEVGSGRENITSQPHNVPKYEHNVDCKILIHRSADALSTLYFDFFDMEDDLFCSKDALDVSPRTSIGKGIISF